MDLSNVSRAINTAFIERENGTDRHSNARKARKTCRFGKDRQYHDAFTYSILHIYNFRRAVPTLSVVGARKEVRRWRRGRPIMSGR